MPREGRPKRACGTPGEVYAAIRERVEAARQIQRERFRRTHVQCNAEMSSRQLRRHCELDPSSRRFIEQAIARLGLSARAYDRVLKVARTIADLAGSERLQSSHVAEAVHYRALDRGYFRSVA
jgi:magnesium chelatase family protein